MTSAMSHPVAPGEPAPDFALPAVAGPETVSLADYRGRSPVFLALMVGLWCPFCRRQLVQLGKLEGKLKALGVESLARGGDRARERAAVLQVQADAAAAGVRPRAVDAPRLRRAQARADAGADAGDGDHPRQSHRRTARAAADPRGRQGAARRLDGYACTPADLGDIDRQWPQLKAHVHDRPRRHRALDRHRVRRRGLAGIGKLPSEEVILDAARALH